MIDFGSGPGLWAVVFLLVMVAVKVLGGWLARPHFRKLNELALSKLKGVAEDSEPNRVAHVRRRVHIALKWATIRYLLPVLAVAAPFFFVAEMCRAVVLLFSKERRDRLRRKVMRDHDEFFELDDTAMTAAMLSRLFSSAWLVTWLIVPFALQLLIVQRGWGLLDGAQRLLAAGGRHVVILLMNLNLARSLGPRAGH